MKKTTKDEYGYLQLLEKMLIWDKEKRFNCIQLEFYFNANIIPKVKNIKNFS